MPEDIQAFEKELRELRDIEEIRRLRGLYTRYLDMHDWDRLAALLSEDYYLESDGGPQEGRDEVIAGVSSALAEASTVHHVYAPDIRITGPDTASATWRMEDWVRLTYQGKPMAFHGHGFYHDEYVRTDEGWRVRRTVSERLRIDPIEHAPKK